MYVAILEGDNHVSDDGWQTLCNTTIGNEYLLYECDPETVTKTVGDTNDNGIHTPDGTCPDCIECLLKRDIPTAHAS